MLGALAAYEWSRACRQRHDPASLTNSSISRRQTDCGHERCANSIKTYWIRYQRLSLLVLPDQRLWQRYWLHLGGVVDTPRGSREQSGAGNCCSTCCIPYTRIAVQMLQLVPIPATASDIIHLQHTLHTLFTISCLDYSLWRSSPLPDHDICTLQLLISFLFIAFSFLRPCQVQWSSPG